MNNLIPSEEEVEITLIGTGGGYGECILIKLAKESWVIVDSCVNPTTKNSLALEYLLELKINFDFVKLIICTHWHDDHINGLSEIIDKCKNSKFSFTNANDLKKFLSLCGLDYVKVEKGAIGSTLEFSKCLEILKQRNNIPIRACHNLTLFNEQFNNVKFEIIALSPSPQTLENFDIEISSLITEFGKSSVKIPYDSPNDKSIVLLLKFNDNLVLLGGDLENGDSDNVGWRHIINNNMLFDNKKANLFKIPHHGSKTAYMSSIFDVLVNKESVLKLTPWNRNKKLPTSEMLRTYLGHSNEVFLTSPIVSTVNSIKRDKPIEKMIKEFSKSLTLIKYSKGIVRSRIDYTKSNANWETDIFDSAVKIILPS